MGFCYVAEASLELVWAQPFTLLGLSMSASMSGLSFTFEFIWKYFILKTFPLSYIV